MNVIIGDSSAEERERAKRKQIVIATYKIMAEGTDIPALDTLFMATPKVDIEQVVGRIQRPADDKKRLLVIMPVFQLPSCKKAALKAVDVLLRLGFKEQR